MRSQGIYITRNRLKERQGLFKTDFKNRGETVKIDNIVENSLITLICKTKFSESLKRFLRPSKVGVAKSLIGNLCFLKYRDCFFRLLILFIFTQKTIVVMDVSMYTDLS